MKKKKTTFEERLNRIHDVSGTRQFSASVLAELNRTSGSQRDGQSFLPGIAMGASALGVMALGVMVFQLLIASTTSPQTALDTWSEGGPVLHDAYKF